MRIPLRIRLALLFSLAMALVLAGVGLFAYARIGSDLSHNLDQELRGRAQDLTALVRHGGSLRSTDGRLLESGESFAQLVAADGRVLDATPPLGRQSLLEGEQLARARHGALFVDRPSVPGLDEPARMLAVPLGRRVLVAGATRENRAETLSSVRDAFLIGGPIALLLASLGGYALAGAALRPIEAMRHRAAEISTSSLANAYPCRTRVTRSRASVRRSTRCSDASRVVCSANGASSPMRAISCARRSLCSRRGSSLRWDVRARRTSSAPRSPPRPKARRACRVLPKTSSCSRARMTGAFR